MTDFASLQDYALYKSVGKRTGSVKLTAVPQTCVTQVSSCRHMPLSLEHSCALRWKPYMLSRKVFSGQLTGKKFKNRSQVKFY